MPSWDLSAEVFAASWVEGGLHRITIEASATAWLWCNTSGVGVRTTGTMQGVVYTTRAPQLPFVSLLSLGPYRVSGI